MNAAERFVSSVASTIRRRRMLKGGERVVVAVSGGPDSLALLHALRALAPSSGLELHVAHFDHRMREGSEADAAFVARVARRLSLPITLGSAPPDPRPAGLSPEEAARERRLRFLEDTADATGADRIATGHTLDDQAETVLMRLLTGAGARGLGGIPPVRGRFIRPLIDRRRAEIESYCRMLGLRPRQDPTNEATAFLRNAIRRDVLPFLAGRVNGRLPEALARTADVLRDEDELLDRMAAEAVDLQRDAEGARVDADRLLALPVALRRRVVRLMLGPPGFDLAQIERILDLAESGRSGDSLDLPQPLKARLEYGSLLIGRATSPASATEAIPMLVPGRTDLPWSGAAVTVWEERVPPAAWPDGRTVCVVDAERAGGPLVARRRRRGDRMTPLGMRGSKTVADLLSEAKVPRAERDTVPVIASADGIVWVAGHRIDELCKVTARTKRFMWMAFEGGAAWRS